MGSIGPTELIIVGIIVVLLFGATRLPATAKGLGQALRLFKKEVTDDDRAPAATEPVAPPPAAITAATPQPVRVAPQNTAMAAQQPQQQAAAPSEPR